MNISTVTPTEIDWSQLFNALNIGLILVDSNGEILLWNEWISKHSGINYLSAINQPLELVFPEKLPAPFVAAIKRCINTKLPVVLSNALHKYPLPLYSPQKKR